MMDVSSLPLMEHFYTIQGEGAYSGTAAYFLRLGGCDVGCVWCDVKESWDVNKHALVSVDQMLQWVQKAKATRAVVTGGEPLMHNCTSLTQTLKENGINVHMETSGAYPISGSWDWICLSPKKFKAPLKEVLAVANELKVVIFNKSDFDWAIQHASLVNQNCLLFLQPEWSRQKEMLPLIIDFVKENPQWRIGLQTHKFMQIP